MALIRKNSVSIIKTLTSISMLLGATACSATMVNPPGPASAPSAYAPLNQQSRNGLVKYLNQGADSVIAARREDAYKQMYTSCNGKYNIVNEGPVSAESYLMPMGTGFMSMQSEYWGIEFSCAIQ